MLAEALEHLVSGLVANPEDVQVVEKQTRRGKRLEVHVNPNDTGKVIGRDGRTAKALRTVVNALTEGDDVRVDIVDANKRRRG